MAGWPDGCVDLIYADPPFNTGKVWKDRAGFFEDNFGGASNYTYWLRGRIVQMHRILSPGGSIYLHCDSKWSHYVKIIMDDFFGWKNFRNEIVWKRTYSHNDAKRNYGNINDRILFYTKSDEYTWNRVYQGYSKAWADRHKHRDKDGRRYRCEVLIAKNLNPNAKNRYEWHGVTPSEKHQWRFPKDEMDRLYDEGRIVFRRDGKPRKDGLIVYWDENKGQPAQDLWLDIDRVGNTSKERTGYPTQKPLALLDRIIQASSNPGDMVLDPFCGSGTALVSAARLGRQFVGIDQSEDAVNLSRDRVRDVHGQGVLCLN